MTELAPSMILALLDGLAGIAPVGFDRAELSFARQGEHAWGYEHAAIVATAGAQRLDDLIDAEASARMLSSFASDLAPLLGPAWDGRLVLTRLADGYRLECSGSAPVVVEPALASARTFNDEVLAELGRLRTVILAKEYAFAERYGEPSAEWWLDPAAARLTTPHGPLDCALLGSHEGHMLHWATTIEGPPAGLLEPLRALGASGKAPPLLARGRLVVWEEKLAAPLAWLLAHPLGAEAVILWPHEPGSTLVLGLLVP
jgi:hypothetical protein